MPAEEREPIDYGIRGIDAEPRGGYARAASRDAHLEAFSDAAWQRHEARSRRPSPSRWPAAGAYRANWPLLALDLLVAAWKISEAESPFEAGAIDAELLDPPPPPAERSWRAVYAEELAAHPALARDLEHTQGDGVELVLERAHLKAGERAVMRGLLYGEDLRSIAEELTWRPQTVVILARNASARLRDRRWARPQLSAVRSEPAEVAAAS